MFLFRNMPFFTQATDPEENTFMDSLRTFLAGKGRSIHKEPRWRGKRINLYRFYNTVQRYGGCEQVRPGQHCVRFQHVYGSTIQLHLHRLCKLGFSSYVTSKTWNFFNFKIFFQGLGFLEKPRFFYRNLENP